MTQSQNEQYLFETLLDHGAPAAQPSLRAAELSEAEVAEVASELLSAENEAEIERLLPKLLPARKLAAAGLSRLAARPAGRSAARRTARLIKRLTAAVLSNLRRAGVSIPDPDLAGDPFPGDAVGGLFGGEMSEPRELEFEVAKKLVRFGNGAMCRSLLAARHQPPAMAARTAVVSAAKSHAPGLLGRAGGCPVCAHAAASREATRGAHAGHAAGHAGAAPRTSGHWVRRPTGIQLTA